MTLHFPCFLKNTFVCYLNASGYPGSRVHYIALMLLPPLMLASKVAEVALSMQKKLKMIVSIQRELLFALCLEFQENWCCVFVQLRN